MNHGGSAPGPVVVGVDGSAAALEAVRWAARDAARRHIPVRLVHAYTPAGLDYPSQQRSITQMREQGGAWLHVAAIVAAEAAPTVPVDTTLREGDPRVVLLDESRRAAVVVLSSRGLHGVSRLLLGSAGLALAIHGRCPVVVVRGAIADGGPVVVGVDGWPASAAAVQFAFQQASLHGTRLTAVRTWDEHTALRARLGIGTAGSMAVHDEERSTLIERVSGLATEFPDVPVDHIVVRGRPGRTLLEYGEHARLIVVGARGRSGFAGLLLGSTSQAVAQHGPCPVAIVRPEVMRMPSLLDSRHHATGR